MKQFFKTVLCAVLCAALAFGGLPWVLPRAKAETSSNFNVEVTGTLIENYSGYTDYGYLDDGTYVEYFWYECEDILRMTYDLDGEIVELGYGAYNITTDQSCENPWGLGRHTIDVEMTYNGESDAVKVEVEVVKNPVESITAEQTTPIYEGQNGSENTDDDGSTWFYYYDLTGPFTYTITYNDGREPVTGTYYELGNMDIWLTVSADQYQNHLQVGDNRISVSYMGQSFPLTLTISPNPVESITAEQTKPIYENQNGYENTDDEGNTWFYYYDLYEAFTYTVTFNDGREPVTGTYYELGDMDVWVDVSTDQYQNHLTVGKNEVQVSYMGKSFPITLTISPNPVEDITAEQIKPIYENDGGYERTDDDEPYFYYDQYTYRYAFEYTVTFNDGRDPVTGTYEELQEQDISLRFSDDQGENHWAVGENAAVVSYLGREFDLMVTISKNPVESITAEQTTVIYENSNGYENVDEDDTWYYYYINDDMFTYTITFNDGREPVTGTYSELANMDIYVSLSTDQYKEHFVLGKNKATVSYMGKSFDVTVTISPNPVENITAEQIKTIYENDSGYENTDDDGNTWFYYDSLAGAFTYTITFNDGRKPVTGTYYDLQEQDIWLDVSADQYETHFVVGKNKAKVSYMGKSFDITVTISPCPIESITTEQVKPLYEDSDGYENTDEKGNTWFYYYWSDEYLSFTVTFNDGREPVSGSYWDLNKAGVSLSYVDDQEDNHWAIGENKAWVSCFGKRFEVTVTVSPNPVESITAEQIAPIYENWNGSERTDDDGKTWYYYSSYADAFTYTVTFNDGRDPLTGTRDEIGNDEDVWLDVYADQYETHWAVGKNKATVAYMGREFDLTVTVSASPVESITAEQVTPVYENWQGSEYGDDGESWFKYDSYYYKQAFTYTVTFNDGREPLTGSYYDLQNEDVGLSFSDTQDETHWKLGKNKATVNCLGKKTEITVTVSASPVKSVTAKQADPLYENWNGYTSTDADGLEYYRYETYSYADLFVYTVTFNDGRESVTGTRYDLENENIPLNISDDQYHTHWKQGKNTATVSCLGKRFDFTVTVSPTPVKSVTAKQTAPVYENWNGYERTDDDGKTWFYYNSFADAFTYTVTFNDGRAAVTGTRSELASQNIGLTVNDGVQNDTHWKQGENKTTGNCLGKSFDLTVTVSPTPVKSVAAEQVAPVYENWGGYEDTDSKGNPMYYYNDGTYADMFIFTVTFNDGRETVKGTLDELRGTYDVGIEVSSDQYTTPWKLGKNTAKVNCFGNMSDFTVTVSPSPVESITVEQILPVYENWGGYETTDGSGKAFYRYDVDDYKNDFIYTVTFNDGREPVAGTYSELRWGSDVELRLSDEQYETHWAVGKNKATVNCFGKKAEITVTVSPTPVKSVTAKQTSPVYENWQGETYKDASGKKYFYYSTDAYIDAFTYTVTFNDGRASVTGTYDELRWDHDIDLRLSDDQEKTHWALGKNKAQGNCLGKSFDLTVTVSPSPVESVTAVQIAPLYENDASTGYVQKDAGGKKYFYYDYYAGSFAYTVTYNDGRPSVTGTYNELRWDYGVDIRVNDEQEKTHWAVGKNKATVSSIGKEFDLNVTVSATPVKSVTAKQTDKLYVCDGGYETTDDYNADYYYYNNYGSAFTFTVTFNDGRAAVTGTLNELRDRHGLHISVSADQNKTHWAEGKNTATVNCFGKESDFTVTLSPSPVKTVAATQTEPVYLNANGYLRTDGNGKEWFCYYDIENAFTYTVTFNDGRAPLTGTYNELEDEISFSVLSSQSQEKTHWALGKNTLNVRSYGVDYPITVNITESPIKNVTAKQVKPIYENDLGSLTKDDKGKSYFSYRLDTSAFEYTVTFTDGRKAVTGTVNDLYHAAELSLELSSEQSKTHWAVGKNTMQINCLGKTFDATVTISKSPVKSITAKQVRPVIENLDGYWTGSAFSYFRYRYADAFEFTVSFNDGRANLVVPAGELGKYTELSVSDKQSSAAYRFKAGKNTATVKCCGTSVDFTVTVSGNTAKSVSVSNVRTVSGKKDGRIGSSGGKAAWGYRAGSVVFDFTVTFTDGAKKTYTYFDGGLFGGYPVESSQITRNYNYFYDDGTYYYYVNEVDLHENACVFMPDENNKLHFTYMNVPFEVTLKDTDPLDPAGSFDYVVQKGEAFITGYYGGALTELTIPAKLGGKNVAGVLSLDTKYSSSLSVVNKLIVPDGVRSISAEALAMLTGCTEIVLGKDVNGLSMDMFLPCRNLRTVTVSDKNPNYTAIDGVLYNKAATVLTVYPISKTGAYSVPDSVSNIDVYVFTLGRNNVLIGKGNGNFIKENGVLYNKAKTEIIKCDADKAGAYVMPSTVKNVAEGAFVNCTLITSVTVSDKVTDIVYYTFAGCTSLTDVKLPTSVKSIGADAFEGSGLSSIDLSSVQEIGENAFNGTSLEKANLSSAKSIGYGAFRNTLLADVKFSSSLTEISEAAFHSTKLTSVSIPSSVKKIGYGAFYGTALKTLTLPDSVTELGSYAFGYCKDLSKVTIGSGLTVIPYGCFVMCEKLTSIEIPATVTLVEDRAFANSGLTGVTMKSKSTAYCTGTFYGCSIAKLPKDNPVKLSDYDVYYDEATKTIRFMDGVTDIVYRELGWGREMPAGTTVNKIPVTVRHIGSRTLTSLWLKDKADGVTYVGDALLRSNDALGETVSVRKGTRIIADAAFNKDNITAVTLPEGLTTIGSYAFNATRLKKVTLPASLTTIGAFAFADTGITEITIPAAVTEIGDFAFAAPNLKTITVDAKNTAFTVKDGVLYTKDMTELVCCPAQKTGELKVPATVRVIRNGAFDSCSALTAVYLPQSITMDIAMFGKQVTDFESSSAYPDSIYYEPVNCPLVYVGEDSAAEESVKRIGLPFSYYDAPASTTPAEEPGTDKPTPGTSDALTVQSSDKLTADADDNLRVLSGATAADLLAASNATRVLNADGTPAASDSPVGTGMKLVLEKNGKVTDEMDIIVPGDADGDGGISAADARIALRQAVKLENYTEDTPYYKACNVDGALSEGVSASDARMILRAAVGLEKTEGWLTA